MFWVYFVRYVDVSNVSVRFSIYEHIQNKNAKLFEEFVFGNEGDVKPDFVYLCS